MPDDNPRRSLDKELSTIRDDILRMGSLVYRLTQRSVNAFIENDSALAKEVLASDDEIDMLHHRVEKHVTLTFALQQPMATDLRYLIATMLIANELERMADHATGIAKTVLLLGQEGKPDVPPLIPQMLEHIRQMIYDSMDAYIARNPAQARKIASRDDYLDTLYATLFEHFVAKMRSGEIAIERGTYVLWAGHNLERIGDRVTNICERVAYVSTGEVDELNPSSEA